jgi:hypothetical protein
MYEFLLRAKELVATMEKGEILKLTIPKLREEALKIENISGVHGMTKTTLIEILFDHFGYPMDQKKKKTVDPEAKKKLKEFQVKRNEASKAKDKKQAEIYRKKIHRLRRQTRVN